MNKMFMAIIAVMVAGCGDTKPIFVPKWEDTMTTTLYSPRAKVVTEVSIVVLEGHKYVVAVSTRSDGMRSIAICPAVDQ